MRLSAPPSRSGHAASGNPLESVVGEEPGRHAPRLHAGGALAPRICRPAVVWLCIYSVEASAAGDHRWPQYQLAAGGEPDGSARVLSDDLLGNVAVTYSTDGQPRSLDEYMKGFLKRAAAGRRGR